MMKRLDAHVTIHAVCIASAILDVNGSFDAVTMS